MRDFLRAYALVARYEYFPAEIPGLFIPLFLGATSFGSLFSYTIIEAVVVFALLFLSGFLTNSLTDIDVDRKYKTHIPAAVNIVGRRKLKLIIALHVSTALILSFHISMVLQNIWLFGIVIIGTFFGLGYSIEPFHFKIRGIWHAVALMMSAFFIPMLFLYCVVSNNAIDLKTLLLLIGFSTAHYGIALTNQIGDYKEDMDTGLLTPAVRWGIKNTIKLSVILTTIGVIIGAYTFTEIMMERGTANLLNIGADYRLLTMGIVTTILGIAYLTPIAGTLSLYRIARRSKTIVECMDRIKKRLHYSRWQASGVFGVFIVVTMLFATTIINNYKNIEVENPIVSINAGRDITTNIGMIVNFNGVVTTNVDKSKLNYTWIFYDTPYPVNYYRLNSTHVFSKEGIYPVAFVVTDASGNKFIDEINVTVKRGFHISNFTNATSATWELNLTNPLKIDVEITTTINNAGVNQTDNITLIIEQDGTDNRQYTNKTVSLRTNETVTYVITMKGDAAVHTFSITLLCNKVVLDKNTIVAKRL
jgi:4-hydroxybenzoate polyprenyltransferase